MDIAIVTGANSRIGLAISRKLIEIGCRVYGLGNDFTNFPLGNRDFIPVVCDLTDTEHLCKAVSEIMDREKNIYVLVNHARHVSFDEHEKQELNDLEHLVKTNLLAPLLLTRLALPSIIKMRGYIINIGFPDLPGSERLGSSFLATETALREFSHRLYEEVRQDKVRVTSLIIDSAKAKDLFKEGYTERDNHDLIVCSEAVAQAVDYVVSQKRDSVISQLTVRPQKAEPTEEDKKAVREVPAAKPYTFRGQSKPLSIGKLEKPKQKQAPAKKGPTSYMDMARAAAAEEEALKKIQGPEGVLERIDGEAPESEEPIQQPRPQANEGEGEERDPRRRRRRRRGRGRGRNREEGEDFQRDHRTEGKPAERDESRSQDKPAAKPEAKAEAAPVAKEATKSEAKPEQEGQDGERRRRSRRRGRNRGRSGDRSGDRSYGEHYTSKPSDSGVGRSSQRDSRPAPKPEAKPEAAPAVKEAPKSEAPEAKAPAKKAARKRVAKKAATQAAEGAKPVAKPVSDEKPAEKKAPAKKAAAKKTVAKKAVAKKAATKKVAAKTTVAKKAAVKKTAVKKTAAKKAAVKKTAAKKTVAKKAATKKVAAKKTAKASDSPAS